MRLVVQRVTRAEVRSEGQVLGAIGRGAAVLVKASRSAGLEAVVEALQ